MANCYSTTALSNDATVTVYFEGLMLFAMGQNCEMCDVRSLLNYDNTDAQCDNNDVVSPSGPLVRDHFFSINIIQVMNQGGSSPTVQPWPFLLNAANDLEIRILGAPGGVSLYQSGGSLSFDNILDLEGSKFHSNGIKITGDCFLNPLVRIFNGTLYSAAVTDKTYYSINNKTKHEECLGKVCYAVGLDIVLGDDQTSVQVSEIGGNSPQTQLFMKQPGVRYIIVIQNADPDDVDEGSGPPTDFVDYYNAITDGSDPSVTFDLTTTPPDAGTGSGADAVASPPAPQSAAEPSSQPGPNRVVVPQPGGSGPAVFPQICAPGYLSQTYAPI
jgi:hypothetical protein